MSHEKGKIDAGLRVEMVRNWQTRTLESSKKKLGKFGGKTSPRILEISNQITPKLQKNS
jgi:hypothetical protein